MNLRPPNFRLESLPGTSGPLNRVLVGARIVHQSQRGIFSLFPGEPGEVAIPVLVVGMKELPDDLVLVRSGLLEHCGATAQQRQGWELRLDGLRHVIAEEVSLELLVQEQLEQFAGRVSRDLTLDGRLLYVPAGRPGGTLTLELDGEPTRIRDIRPAVTEDAIYEISANATIVTLLAPSHRAGVDVVILADCSGSMASYDLTVGAEAPPPPTSIWQNVFGGGGSRVQYQSRSDALVQALLDLLDRRLLAAGTVGRMALVAFGNTCEQRFPRANEPRGMIEIDETASEDVRAQFRQAIRDLLPNKNWGTNIGQALQFAASHLSNHGKPGNERLIVVVSDGAHWKAKGDAGAGELLEDVLSEPVSLMDILHTRMGIRLHAIGISDPGIYERWVRSDPKRDPRAYLVEALIPNHKLLEELVRVGGGDPARTGDASVLEDYFRGLGEGVTTRIRVATRRENEVDEPSVDEMTFAAKAAGDRAKRLQTSQESTLRLTQLRDHLKEGYFACNKFARALSNGYSLFTASPEANAELFDSTLVTPVTSERDFRLFQTDVYKVFDEGLPAEIRIPDKAVTWPEPFPSIKKYLHSGDFRRLGTLRHAGSHDITAPARIRDLADTLRFFVGVPVIESGDSALWLTLQISVVELVRSTVDELLGMLRHAVEQEKRAAGPEATETLIQW